MKLIAFTLFGLDNMYAAGAVANARLAQQHYPGWTPRFYVGDSVTAETTAELERLGAQVVRMTGRREDWSALLWRFNALVDQPDAVIFRDCDSRLDAREAAAVDEWLASGADFHIMRDHPEHCLPILAGMWGCSVGGARRIVNLRPSNLPSQHPFIDQEWLRDTVYPVACTSMLVHDEFGHVPGEPARQFPMPRQPLADGNGWAFAGQGYTADGSPRWPEHALSVEPRHEWRLFDEGTVPEYTTPAWYVGREHAPHLEQGGHRARLLATATFVAQAAFTHGIRTVVDLGSGDGGLLSLLGPNLQAWGYDLMPANVEAAKERGVDVRYGDVLADPVEWADIAVCTEMLEHLVDPHAFVRTIIGHCRALVCSSPRDERKGHAYEFHTWAWDLEGYRALLEQAGWRVQRQKAVDRFQVILAVRP